MATLCLLCAIGCLQAQEVDGVVKTVKSIRQQSLQISGGLNLYSNFYHADGIAARRDALQWRALANLNLSYLGIDAPFSLAFSDGNQQFNLPAYTFVGISPTYKWARLHLGDRSLNFSKYTLNNINFKGAGFELRPGRFYIAGMYGQLRRAVAEDFNSLQMLDPAYRRTGQGLKAGFSNTRSEINLTYFAAKDDPNSIVQPLMREILPSSNIVLSVSGRQQLGKKANLEGEVARSGLNRDVRSELLPNPSSGQSFLGLFKPTSSLITGTAYRAKLNFSVKGFNFNTGYERIERGFQTLGALFFLSDAEYLTLGFSRSFMKNRLSIFANGGQERTNLDDFERNGTRRLVGSFNGAYTPSKKWSFNASYSNFQNTTKIRALTSPDALVDSIILAQATQTASFSAVHYLNTGNERPSSLSFFVTYQRANSIVDDVVQDNAASRFLNGSLIYAYSITDRDLRLSAALNVNQTQLVNLDNLVLAPTLGITKGFLNKRLQTNLRIAYNQVFQKIGEDNAVINLSLGSNWQLTKAHMLGFNTTLLNRSAGGQTDDGFLEWYGQLMYGYRFLEQVGGAKSRPANTSNGN